MKMYTLSLVISFMLLLIPSAVSAGPTSYLPVTHRAHTFLTRMEASGRLNGLHLSSKSLSRASVAAALIELAPMSPDLPRADREEYGLLTDEFAPDMAEKEWTAMTDHGPLPHVPGVLGDLVYRNRRNLYAASGERFTLFVDPVMVRTGSFGDDPGTGEEDNVFVEGNGVRLYGTIGGRIGFFTDVRDSKEWGSRDYPVQTVTTLPGRGFATFKDDHAEFDETHAHITYANGPFTLTWGRGQHAWGYGASGNPGLSAYAAPSDYFRLEAEYWKLRFIFLTAELEQYPPVAKNYYPPAAGTVQDSVTVQKRMSAHRLEIDLTDRVSLGLYEMVVYGGRYEWSYLNPLMFLKGAEHANGDHDNAAMGADARVRVGPNSMLYGELFIDDISTTKLGTDWYGNKLAFQGGLFTVDPFGLGDSDICIEYTRINPWVYTHRYPINTYTHYGDVLGHRIGPNADMILANITKRFTRRIELACSVTYTREGENPPGINVGGDPLDGYSPGDSRSASFLQGDVMKTARYGVQASYEIARECFISAGLEHINIDGDGANRVLVAFRLND